MRQSSKIRISGGKFVNAAEFCCYVKYIKMYWLNLNFPGLIKIPSGENEIQFCLGMTALNLNFPGLIKIPLNKSKIQRLMQILVPYKFSTYVYLFMGNRV